MLKDFSDRKAFLCIENYLLQAQGWQDQRKACNGKELTTWDVHK